MKVRKLAISGELWFQWLKHGRAETLRVIKNRLPEDTKFLGLEASGYMASVNQYPIVVADCPVIWLLVTSSVFQDDDPDELPSPILQVIPKGE